MELLQTIIAGLLAVVAFVSFVNITYGIFPLLFGKGPKGDLLGGWMVNIIVFVLCVTIIFALRLHML